MDKINICFISHYSTMYGANRSLLSLIEGLGVKINPIVILPRYGPLANELEQLGIEYKIVHFKNWMNKTRYKSILRIIVNIKAVFYLRKILAKRNIQLVYTNSSVIPVGIWLSRLMGLYHVWHIREYGWHDYQLKYDFGKNFFNYWLNKSDHIISISKSIDKEILNKINAPVSIVSNGVMSLSNANEIIIRPFRNNSITFGIIGYLNHKKGQINSIKAFFEVQKKYPESILIIAGTGEKSYEKKLFDLVDDLKISDKVQFLGYVENPLKFYDVVDVVLMCSEKEAFGRVTAEAMMLGKLVIGNNSGATPELIDHKVNGLIYDGSIGDLASKMIYAVKHKPKKICIEAHNVAIRNFTNEQYSDSIFKIIRNSKDLKLNNC